jgi:hypothetical protein
MKGSFEDLFYKYKVDLVLQGTFVCGRLCACVADARELWTSGWLTVLLIQRQDTFTPTRGRTRSTRVT